MGTSQVVKNLPANAGNAREVGSIPGLGRSPRVGSGNPPQYSCQRTPWTEKLEGYGPWAHRVRHN